MMRMSHSAPVLIDPYQVFERAGVLPGWHVADLGCGALGHFAFSAARLVGGHGRVYAVDVQKTALHAIGRAAKAEQHWNVVPVWADFEMGQTGKIPPDSVDLTLFANALYLAQNRPAAIQEAIRLTKPGGLLLIIDWKTERIPIGPAMDDRLSPDEARTHLRVDGIEEIDAFDAGDCHYALLFQKALPASGVRVESVSHPIF